MEGGGDAPQPFTVPLGERICEACGDTLGMGVHACKHCKSWLHSSIVCQSVWLPIEGEYFCSRRCLGAYNDLPGEQKVPVRCRPDAAETPHAQRERREEGALPLQGAPGGERNAVGKRKAPAEVVQTTAAERGRRAGAGSTALVSAAKKRPPANNASLGVFGFQIPAPKTPVAARTAKATAPAGDDMDTVLPTPIARAPAATTPDAGSYASSAASTTLLLLGADYASSDEDDNVGAVEGAESGETEDSVAEDAVGGAAVAGAGPGGATTANTLSFRNMTLDEKRAYNHEKYLARRVKMEVLHIAHGTWRLLHAWHGGMHHSVARMHARMDTHRVNVCSTKGRILQRVWLLACFGRSAWAPLQILCPG